MSSGRFIMRGRVFQGRVFAPRALSGGGVVSETDPNDGWTTSSRNRLLIANDVDRLFVVDCRERLWVAKDKTL